MNKVAAAKIAATLVRRFEGFEPFPYLCPALKWTIGYGTTRYPNGVAVAKGDPPVTIARAEELMTYDLLYVRMPSVLSLCPGIDTEGRLAAILDFTYNLGVGNLRASTMRRKINAGQWGEAAAECKKWTRSKGQILLGLVRRRAAEVALF